ncbi:ATP-binding cassette domain-containing protein [Steroidobacter sp. S1-65]|uniref:ATP-binding cassette domain-containing protein n=1 Tax=Steroidobacter gossypii TaxID=2805490 RepID=A0ABS1WQF8_9GAMM|nr:ATP-binding cassette domain-containing protein [Steroidobacter gossypii]MBM0103215.1 ATP-binding cassette domain-containing protein [Steroidobacter gossypii]
MVAKTSVASAPLIELAHCSLIFDAHQALDEVSFTLRRGERWALIGANGSGKTMLLKMLRGDMWPTPTGRQRRTSSLAKEQIAYVGPDRQDKYVRYGWNLTVTQVVTTGLFDEDIPLTKPTQAQRERVTRVLKRFGLWGLRQRRILTLSYGQRRLTLVARLFAGNAPVLLLDEVFNGLDVRAKEKLRKALEQPRGGHDWILTSHRPKELPKNVTHVAHLEHGRIVSAGPIGHEHAIAHTEQPSPPRHLGKAVSQPRDVSEPGREKPGLATRLREAAKAANRLRGISGQAREKLVARPRGAANAQHQGDTPAGAKLKPLVVIRNADIYRDYRPVIRGLDWTLARGENWAILGANGSGKSSLLNLIYGDLHPALGGSIERDGVPKGTHIEAWKHRVGWVSPELQADHYLATSIEEIVISGRYASVGLNDAPTDADRKVADRWLEFFNIEHLRARGPRQVSYGQMRMALFARAMMNNPELLLLDEPCTGLDGDVRATVLGFIEQLAEQGTQIVMAVHDPEDIVPAVKHVLRIGRGGKAEQVAIDFSW